MPCDAINTPLKPPAVRRHVTRRLALTGALVLAALGLGAPGELRAQGVHGFRRKMKAYKEKRREQPSQGWLDAIMPGRRRTDAPDATVSATPALLTAAAQAVAVGNPAREYCVERTLEGNTALQPALESIQAMLPVANALAKLAELNARRLKEMAKPSIDFLRDCETACRLQAGAHPPCRACADACAAAILECRKLIGV